MAKSTTFKGQAKPMGKSGHFYEPRRHALASKGIRTGHLMSSLKDPIFYSVHLDKENKKKFNAGKLSIIDTISDSLDIPQKAIENVGKKGNAELYAIEEKYLGDKSVVDALADNLEQGSQDIQILGNKRDAEISLKQGTY